MFHVGLRKFFPCPNVTRSLLTYLPSLEVMAEEMQVDERHLPSGAAAPSPPPTYASVTPMPGGPSSSTSHGHQPQADHRDLPFIMGDQPLLRPAERRTQTVHTVKFQRIRHGNAPTELKVEETCVNGFSKIKTLEHYFYGILNHWQSYWNSVYMANYWRRFFNVDEIPDDDTTDPAESAHTGDTPDPPQEDMTVPDTTPYT